MKGKHFELAKEKVKEMIEKNQKNHDLRKAAGHNSVPSNKPHYCVSGLLMDYHLEKLLMFFNWVLIKHHIFWKAFGF